MDFQFILSLLVHMFEQGDHYLGLTRITISYFKVICNIFITVIIFILFCAS